MLPPILCLRVFVILFAQTQFCFADAFPELFRGCRMFPGLPIRLLNILDDKQLGLIFCKTLNPKP